MGTQNILVSFFRNDHPTTALGAEEESVESIPTSCQLKSPYSSAWDNYDPWYDQSEPPRVRKSISSHKSVLGLQNQRNAGLQERLKSPLSLSQAPSRKCS